MKKTLFLSAFAALSLLACSSETVEPDTDTQTTTETELQETASAVDAPSLDDILAAQPEEAKARFEYRNPGATLEYFGVKPGMTVAELLPGGGWYSKIVLPYLGDEGHLIGVDYDIDMWAKFGGFVDDKFLEDRKSWSTSWAETARGWKSEGSATEISAFALGNVPEEIQGTVDMVLIIRAIHHMNRFEQAHLADGLADIKSILKPDGIVAIVAHRASEDQDDGWANGDNGYLKQSHVISIMSDAGFELVGEPSEINANPKDKASSADGDIVWRLPPNLGTSAEDPELRAKMQAIGESDRMTLKFRIKS